VAGVFGDFKRYFPGDDGLVPDPRAGKQIFYSVSLRAGWQDCGGAPAPSRLKFVLRPPFAVAGYPTGCNRATRLVYTRRKIEHRVRADRLPRRMALTPSSLRYGGL